MTILMVSLLGGVFIIGSIGGKTVYRTLFYFPYFTAGVATFILWKKLYNPLNGPINNALRPLLDALTPVAVMISPACQTIGIVILVLVGLLYLHMVRRKLRLWRDGESGTVSCYLAMILLSLPLIFCWSWVSPTWMHVVMNTPEMKEIANASQELSFLSRDAKWTLLLMLVFLGIGWGRFLYTVYIAKRKYKCIADRGIGDSAIVDGSAMVLNMALVGLCCVFWLLPEMAAAEEGLQPPQWISDYYWAKPSLLIMGFWGAIGSNNMAALPRRSLRRAAGAL